MTDMTEQTDAAEVDWSDPFAVLDEIERRIRHQAKSAQVGSMEWRAHFADIAHVEAIRAAARGAEEGAGA